MPWHLSDSADGCSGWAVVKDSDGSVVTCHPTKAKATAHLRALYVNVKESHVVDTDLYWLDEAEFSADQRKQLAKSGAAMPDGSYPIRNKADLSNAIQAIGRATNPAAVKAHIRKRARALGLTDMLPSSWSEALETDVGDVDIRPIAEAGGEPDGSVWDVVVIRAGRSKNRRVYSEAVLQKAVPLFEGARVLARSDEAHVAGRDKSVANIVGWLDGAHYAEAAIRARLNISEAAPWLRTMLLDGWKRGKRDLVGLSIRAQGRGKELREGNEKVLHVEEIASVESVDVIVDAAAGGGLTTLVAAEGKEGVLVDPIIKALQAASTVVVRGLLQSLSEAEVTDLKETLQAEHPELVTKLTEALKDPTAEEKAKEEADAKAKAAELAEAAEKDDEDTVPKALAGWVISTQLAETRLPEASKKRLRKAFEGGSFKAADLTEAISDEVKMFAELERENGVRLPAQSSQHAEVGMEEAERGLAALDGMFLGKDAEYDGDRVRRYTSVKEAYIDLTGDRGITGRLPRRGEEGKLGISESNRGAVSVPLFEAETDGNTYKLLAEAGELQLSTWGEILGDSIRRVMQREYRLQALDEWRTIADVVPVSDFRTNRRPRFGGYGDLPSVAELAPYVDMTTPGDEEVTYAATKRGGTETISLEAITNDDLGQIAKIPSRLARAAARTLYKFVFDFLRTNPTMDYDSVALFHANHGNLSSTALSVAAISDARNKMFKQTDMSTNEQLGLTIAHLFVPIELEQLAFELTASQQKPGSADNDANFVRKLSIETHTVMYWTDANDWVAAADKADTPMIEIGFLHGNEEPELFEQSNPQVGSMFDNDTLKYKIRHIYGGDVLDHRGFVKGVVA